MRSVELDELTMETPVTEVASGETAEQLVPQAIVDAPQSLPLDQIVSQIQVDSMIDAADYVASFLVPGGGE
jgi:hypothetical protein